MPLTKEQNEVFDAYDRMFASDGWKMFIEEIKQNQESLFPELMSNSATINEYYFLKGRNDVYMSVLGLQSLMDNVKKDMEEQHE